MWSDWNSEEQGCHSQSPQYDEVTGQQNTEFKKEMPKPISEMEKTLEDTGKITWWASPNSTALKQCYRKGWARLFSEEQKTRIKKLNAEMRVVQ